MCNIPGLSQSHCSVLVLWAAITRALLTLDLLTTDNAILVQLGSHSANPGQTDEEREQYSNGLMRLIRRLKTDDITDIEEIANRITQYRREFIGDVSKIFSI